MIDENSSHYVRRDGKEVCPVLPVAICFPNQAEVNFVDERRRLQRMVRTLLFHVVRRKTSELPVDEWYQPTHGVRVARPKFKQKTCDAGSVRHNASIR